MVSFIFAFFLLISFLTFNTKLNFPMFESSKISVQQMQFVYTLKTLAWSMLYYVLRFWEICTFHGMTTSFFLLICSSCWAHLHSNNSMLFNFSMIAWTLAILRFCSNLRFFFVKSKMLMIPSMRSICSKLSFLINSSTIRTQ